MQLEDILSQLIAFKTVDGQYDEFKACFDYLEDYLTSRNLVVKRHDSEGFESLVATSHDTKQPKVLLQAHIDVVPAGAKGFKLRAENGRLYGRGTYDMKFAAACYLKLIDELKDSLHDYDLGLMITSDEEIGGHNGVEMLLEAGYGAEVCILPDGGDNWAIETTCNGVWIVDLTADGKSAHGSRPWEGSNAIDRLMPVVDEIRQLFDEPSADCSTIVLTQIQGGFAPNQVPDRATATLDMRFINDEEFATKRQQVEEVASKAGLSLSVRAEVNVCTTDLNEPHVAQFVKVVEQITGDGIKATRSLGASDARHFTGRQIPTILIRPDGGGPHSDNEWIDQAGLQQFYEVIKAYVKEAAKKG